MMEKREEKRVKTIVGIVPSTVPTFQNSEV